MGARWGVCSEESMPACDLKGTPVLDRFRDDEEVPPNQPRPTAAEVTDEDDEEAQVLYRPMITNKAIRIYKTSFKDVN